MEIPTVSTSRGISVRLSGVRRVFPGPIQAIAAITLDVPPGQFTAILGPSGCGKSTLLRLIAGLDRPDAGVVHADTRRIAYVFQDAHLLPWRNVLRNVALPLELKGVGKSQRLIAAESAIEQVGLAEARRLYPAQLSGGMRMRVSMARALVTDPQLLLLDEPFAALDEITRQHLDDQLRRLWEERRMTVLFVTHSTNEAVFLANRAVVLSRRPATIVEDRPIDLPERREAWLRATPEFARQTRAIYEALARGGA